MTTAPKRIIELLTENAELHAEVEALKKERDVALEALRVLHDEQNGPPLVKRMSEWQMAMNAAQQVLKDMEG